MSDRKYPKWKPGRYNVSPAFVPSGILGAITASATTTYRMPTPSRRCFIERISYQTGTVPVSAGGTIIATAKKRDNQAAQDVTLSSGLSLESDGITAVNKPTAFTMLSTLTDAQRILQEGDSWFVDVVSDAAIGTNHANAYFVVELLVLE